MAGIGSTARQSREPESSPEGAARERTWVSPGSFESVEEICAWLGTYRERLRVARTREAGMEWTANLV
jgi:hypothetical protein